MDKCIFTTRFKECCKENNYTQESIASKLGLSIDGLKHHLRKSNPNLPPTDIIIKMAEIFDVDAEYLINENRICKHYKTQTICDVTMLNEDSANVLRYLDIDSADILSEILTHPHFEYMLAEIVHYVRFSRNESFVSYDKGNDDFEYIDMDNVTQKALKKFIVTETFSRMLDDIFEHHNDTEFEIIKLKDLEIDGILYAIEQQDDISFIESLIDEFQTKLKKLSPKDPLCTYSHQYFIENIETIAKQRT